MNVGKVSNVLATQNPPRSWAAMLGTWGGLVDSLFAIVGVRPPLLDQPWLASWRWMWGLLPCSEARNAAFTLGAAALWIERWRKATDVTADDDRGPCGARPEPSGQRAEALLRIAAWHIDDARGEAHGRTIGIEPSIPPHERVYTAGQALDRGGISFVTLGFVTPAGRDRLDVARRTLADHPWRYHVPRSTVELSFAETAIASLPDGAWVMTSRDVERFIDIILEDAELPGRWLRATHRTRGGHLEIRERADGRFDVRAVGDQPLGWPLPDQVAERGVDAAYVRAEIEVLLP